MLTSFVQMTVSTMGGVLAVDRSILEAGKNYGATGWRLFRYVLLPAALPAIFTGMRIGVGLTLVLVVAVELTAAQEGLGAFLWTAGQTFAAKNLFSVFIVIAFSGGCSLTGWSESASGSCLGSSGRALLCSCDAYVTGRQIRSAKSKIRNKFKKAKS